ncbi:SynChlorMet cassette radical SAM/SPASM protein ScmE [Desulfobacterales bacterium HSG16]|nr:SynChlorMet cassette radical SAM/SPASM protein ScmE [Desulfobacterales bacterium HSG16]
MPDKPVRVTKTPKSLELAITNRCNLRCTYCSHFSSEGDTGEDLPLERWLSFFEELNQCAVMDVSIQGGEPFIRQDLTEIIDGIVKNRMRFSILTNGTLITDEMASFIKSTGRCDQIQVSIDGSTSEIHDTCRGKGNFLKSVDGLEILRKNGIPVTVRVTIHRHNVFDLENIAKFLLEDLNLPGFSTNSASYIGLCRQYAKEIQLTHEERYFAMTTLLKLSRKYNGRITGDAGPLSEVSMWMEMEAARKKRMKNLSGRGCLKGCRGVFNKIGVRSDGQMVPCIQMPHIALGQINHERLITVWQQHPALNELRRRMSISLDTFDFCKNCPYIAYCTGNCPALAYTITGMENHPSPDACLRKYLEEGGKLPDDGV